MPNANIAHERIENVYAHRVYEQRSGKTVCSGTASFYKKKKKLSTR